MINRDIRLRSRTEEDIGRCRRASKTSHICNLLSLYLFNNIITPFLVRQEEMEEWLRGPSCRFKPIDKHLQLQMKRRIYINSENLSKLQLWSVCDSSSSLLASITSCRTLAAGISGGGGGNWTDHLIYLHNNVFGIYSPIFTNHGTREPGTLSLLLHDKREILRTFENKYCQMVLLSIEASRKDNPNWSLSNDKRISDEILKTQSEGRSDEGPEEEEEQKTKESPSQPN